MNSSILPPPIDGGILKHTSTLGDLIIKPVAKSIAKELIVKNHYSHKWNNAGFGIRNYGIFRASNPNTCLGVAVYGYMKNPKAKIFNHPWPDAWMCELNRMWIDDCLGKNAESILISASLKLLHRDEPRCVAVQSFADGRLGCGTIYKASNFKYYGYHVTTFLRNKRTGEVSHDQNFTNTTSPSVFLRCNIGLLLGDYEAFTVKTYRYIYPLNRHFRFKLPALPYPAYERGETPIKLKRNANTIIDRCVEILTTRIARPEAFG